MPFLLWISLALADQCQCIEPYGVWEWSNCEGDDCSCECGDAVFVSGSEFSSDTAVETAVCVDLLSAPRTGEDCMLIRKECTSTDCSDAKKTGCATVPAVAGWTLLGVLPLLLRRRV